MDWKRANVVPIHKKGDKSAMGHYRPVSLTSLGWKILESIIKERLVEFLECNDIIGDTQYGFRKAVLAKLTSYTSLMLQHLPLIKANNWM